MKTFLLSAALLAIAGVANGGIFASPNKEPAYYSNLCEILPFWWCEPPSGDPCEGQALCPND